MVVDAHRARNVLKKLVHQFRHFSRGHAWAQFLSLRLFRGDGLHRKMQHHLVTAPFRFLGDFLGMFMIRQDGNRERVVQVKDLLGGTAVVSEVVQNNGELRPVVRR